jgi:hypothetical protein
MGKDLLLPFRYRNIRIDEPLNSLLFCSAGSQHILVRCIDSIFPAPGFPLPGFPLPGFTVSGTILYPG